MVVTNACGVVNDYPVVVVVVCCEDRLGMAVVEQTSS